MNFSTWTGAYCGSSVNLIVPFAVLIVMTDMVFFAALSAFMSLVAPVEVVEETSAPPSDVSEINPTAATRTRDLFISVLSSSRFGSGSSLDVTTGSAGLGDDGLG